MESSFTKAKAGYLQNGQPSHTHASYCNAGQKKVKPDEKGQR